MPSLDRKNPTYDAKRHQNDFHIGTNRSLFSANKISNNFLIAICLLVLAFLIVASPNLPDYDTYKEMYYNQGGHLNAINRDPGYVLISSFSANFVSYEIFRILIAFIISGQLFIIFRSFAEQGGSKIGVFVLFVALAPLIIIKAGSQIREGLTLFTWFFVMYNASRRPRFLEYIFFAALCSSIHISAASIWIASGMYWYGLRKSPLGAYITGIAAYVFVGYYIGDISRFYTGLGFGLLENIKRPDWQTFIYWTTFPSLFLVFLIGEGFYKMNNRIMVREATHLLFILRVSIVGLLIGFAMQVIYSGEIIFQRTILSDYLRYFSFVASLISVYLAIIRRYWLSLVIAAFLVADAYRVITSVLGAS